MMKEENASRCLDVCWLSPDVYMFMNHGRGNENKLYNLVINYAI